MYLSKLQLHGFKSFADRTVVDFSPGVTVVVGPNGCGKSNIVDAVRWVIGEQRARILRSEKMDNVIFNGTTHRRALGMSEVLLTIENTKGILPTEYGEVTIGRRLFRSGESEYLLNGIQCRLKDITDLFMDTGMGAGAYSVIELKMIEDILSENAQDRRHMFEEAAGITKYKVRRNQTLRKLDSTQVDLNRVRDLVEELDKRVASLQRQAQKASRFKTLDDRLRHLILSLAVTDYRILSTEDVELDSALVAISDQTTGLSAGLADEEATHEALRKEHVEKEQALVSAQTEFSNHLEMLRSAETDLRLNEERRESIQRDLARADEEEGKASAMQKVLEATLERTAADLERSRPEVESTGRKLEEAKKKHDAIEGTLSERRLERLALADTERHILEELVGRRTRIERLASKIELLDSDLKESENNLVDIVAELERIDKQVLVSSEEYESAKTHVQTAQEVLEKARIQRTAHQTELEASESELHRLERQLDAVEAEKTLLESILSSYEEFSDSVRFLAESKDWSKDDVQTVADLFSCDKNYRIAVDQALGPFAAYLVVASESEAHAAIHRLRDNEKGRATFVILDRLEQRTPSRVDTPISDAVSLASIVRTPSSAYDGLVHALLGSSFLVDDLDVVQKVKPIVGRYFTLSGEWYDSVGVRYGGSRIDGLSPVASRIGRREQLERARASRDTMEKQLGKLRSVVEKARDVVAALPIDRLETELQAKLTVVTEAEKQLSRITYEREIRRRRRDEIQSRHAQLGESRQSAVDATSDLSEGLAEFQLEAESLADQIKAAEAMLAQDEEAGRKIFSEFNEANIAAVQARHLLENLEMEEQRARHDQKMLAAETRERAERVLKLKTELDESIRSAAALNEEIEKLRSRRGDLDRAVSDAKDALMAVKVSISDLEARLRELRREREQSLSEESRLSIRKAEIKTRLDDLIETMSEDYEISLPSFEMDVAPEFESRAARSEIAEIRGKIRNMGPVNALALESFEGERDRLEFLRKQLSDLEHAENTLKTTISEINETASKRFLKTFNAIQDSFQSLFTELFGDGASAEIVLEDPDDPLETTIEILAKPSGKKPSVLAQLSGGEKTLTAIALLFSIYLVKPSPFCILDEVDAPLDDANVDRFMHLIRTFSDSTQFVLVTHNKRTMEAADRMYGITMQEQGISKLVGVKFERELTLVA